MANVTFVLGESGTGKTTSLRNMNHKENLIIQSINKALPFKVGPGDYTPIKMNGENLTGNLFCTDSIKRICGLLNFVNNTPQIKTICIDDFQYLMSNEYMRRCKEDGWGKFTDIGQNAWHIITMLMGLRKDLNIYILSHTEKKEDGSLKIKTIGKMLDEKITLEGMVTMVLYTVINDGNYLFQTQNNGMNTAKSPMGMFNDITIPNDLGEVNKAINTYYNQN